MRIDLVVITITVLNRFGSYPYVGSVII